MKDRLPKRGRIGYTVAIGAILLLAGFVGSYFALSTIEPPDPADPADPTTYRHFQSRLACRIFYPMGWLEAKFRGAPVVHLRPPGMDLSIGREPRWWRDKFEVVDGVFEP